MPDAAAYSAIVLAGGGSSRLGRDKTRVEVAGHSALDRVLAAVDGAAQIVVVGVPRRLHPARDVLWTQEQPAGGGPAAGVAAATVMLSQPWVVVLAGDLPMVDAATVRRLLTGAEGAYDGAVLMDAKGRRQHLTVALHTEALRKRVVGRNWHGAPMWRLLDELTLAEVEARGHETLDLDDAAAVAAAQRLAHDPKGTS